MQAIEYTSPEQQTKIILELHPHILKCIKDAHGNHVSDTFYMFSNELNNHDRRSSRSSFNSYLPNA